MSLGIRRLEAALVGTRAVLVCLFLTLAGCPKVECTTTFRERTYRVAGYEFSFEDTECDSLGKDWHVSMYARKLDETRKTLLFMYDPGSSIAMPIVTMADDGAIVVHVEHVAVLDSKRERWRDLILRYDFGKEDCPDHDIERCVAADMMRFPQRGAAGGSEKRGAVDGGADH